MSTLEIRKRASEGDAKAQFDLGLMYLKGTQTPKDIRSTAYWWDLAAKNNNPEAQLHLGLMYRYGLHIDEDQAKGDKLIIAASKNGSPSAHVIANHILRIGKDEVL
jgi:TPR repeat protein